MSKLPSDDNLRGIEFSKEKGKRGREPRTCSSRCEHNSRLPVTQLKYRAQGSRLFLLLHSRKTHVKLAPATGQVELISPRTPATQSMNRPDTGQATEYIEPPPVRKAVRTPSVAPLEGREEERRGGERCRKRKEVRGRKGCERRSGVGGAGEMRGGTKGERSESSRGWRKRGERTW